MNDVFRRLLNSFFHSYFKLFMIKKENMLNEIKIEFFFFHIKCYFALIDYITMINRQIQ